MSLMSVSVVIPCLDEVAHIGALLTRIRQQDAPILEVIVVDGGSVDGTPAAVRAEAAAHEAPPIVLVERPGSSIPAALNAAIRMARGDVIVRLDSHCLPSPDYVRRALETLESTGAAVVGGAWDIVPANGAVVARAIAVAVAHPLGAGDADYRLVSPDARAREVDTVPFGCFRREVWSRFGGYDETLRSNEDYELNYRIRRGGGRVILDPSLRCAYVARRTLRALAAQYFRYGWWKAQMLKRHPASIRARQAIPLVFVATLLSLLASSALGMTGPVALMAVLGVYVLVVLFTAIVLSAPTDRWALALAMSLVFPVIHLSWGAGAIVGLARPYGTISAKP